MTMRMRLLRILLVLVAGLMLHAPTASADVSGKITLDTSGLAGGIFDLVLVLIDGSGTGDANNIVTASGFAFGAGGSAGAVDSAIPPGGASGTLLSDVSLVDSTFLNIFAAFFTAGSVLSFEITATTNPDVGLTPDQFSFLLLNTDGTPVVTSDPSGANLLFFGDLDTASPVFIAFASEFTPAPVFTPAAAVAEPSGISLLALALALLGGFAWGARRKKTLRSPIFSKRWSTA